MQTPASSSAALADFYRFAVLLTGNIKAAEEVMAQTLADCEAQVGQIRGGTSRQAWLAARIRERCLKDHSRSEPAPRLLREEPEEGQRVEVLPIEAYLVAQRFHLLPEPERSALALFYLDFLSIEEITRLMKLSEDDLAGALGRARMLLEHELRAMRTTSP